MKQADEDRIEVGKTTVEELERFRQEIARYRARRKAVGDEFDSFVGSFRKPAAPPATDTPRPTLRTTAPARPPQALAAERPAPPSPTAVAPTPAPAAQRPSPPPVVQPPVERSAAQPAAEPRREPKGLTPPAPVDRPTELSPSTIDSAFPKERPDLPTTADPGRRAGLTLVIVAAIGLLVIAALAWQFAGRAPADDPASTLPVTTPPASEPARTPAPPAAPEPPAVSPSDSEITTIRPVWLRVIADGNRVVERELAAGARVPFKAESRIEIRAGDAGAVRLSIGGRDQGALGRDGEVVTRTFTVPPR